MASNIALWQGNINYKIIDFLPWIGAL